MADKAYTDGQLFLRLTAPDGVESAAHPTLPTTFKGDGDIDGWLAADFAHYPYPSDSFLYYVYGTVTAPACANLSNPFTCHLSTGYRTLVWRLG